MTHWYNWFENIKHVKARVSISVTIPHPFPAGSRPAIPSRPVSLARQDGFLNSKRDKYGSGMKCCAECITLIERQPKKKICGMRDGIPRDKVLMTVRDKCGTWFFFLRDDAGWDFSCGMVSRLDGLLSSLTTRVGGVDYFWSCCILWISWHVLTDDMTLLTYDMTFFLYGYMIIISIDCFFLKWPYLCSW